jgi:RimJ/RimL family protein N-acetyltransferase
MPTYTDGVITLRPMTPDDADAHAAGDDAEQVRWLSGKPSTRETALAWILRNMESWAAGGPVFNFGIEEVATGRLMGMVEANADFAKMDGVEEREVNISYALYPNARGRGYATRAVKLILSFVAEGPYVAAVIRADVNNRPSLSVAERCGFQPAGHVISHEVTGIHRMSVFHHSLG